MPTINVPSTEAGVDIPSVSFAERDTKGGFLGGLVRGGINAVPNIIEARKQKMKLLAEGNEDASYQAATMDAEKIIREIGEKIGKGLLPKQAKVEAMFALQKISRETGLTIKAANSLRDTYSGIISVYGEEDSISPGEPTFVMSAYTGDVRVVGTKNYDPEVTAAMQIKSFPKPVQGYFYQIMAEDPTAANDEIGRYAKHLKDLQDADDGAKLADAKLKLNKATKEDQESTARNNLFKSQDTVASLFYSIMTKSRQDVSAGKNPQLALSEANMKFDSLILQNPNLVKLAEAANVPIGQYVDSVLSNWKDRLVVGVTGPDPLLAKARNTAELEAEMKLQDIAQQLKLSPEDRFKLSNSTKFLDAAILKKMQAGTLGVDMPKSRNEEVLEVRSKISHGKEVNRRVTSYQNKTPEGLHQLLTDSASDFANIGRALAQDPTAIAEVNLMDIDSVKRNLETIIKDPNFKTLGPKNQTELLQLQEKIDDVYKRM